MECLSYPDREKRVFLNKVSIISEKKNIIYLRLLLLLLNANKIVYMVTFIVKFKNCYITDN